MASFLHFLSSFSIQFPLGYTLPFSSYVTIKKLILALLLSRQSSDGNEETDGNEDGIEDTLGNEVAIADGDEECNTDGNEVGNEDDITDGNKVGTADGDEECNTDGNEVGTGLNVGVLERVTLGALLGGDEGTLWLKLKLFSTGLDVGVLKYVTLGALLGGDEVIL